MVRVLVVDDSGFMRKIIYKILDKKMGISIVGEAQDGFEMLEKAKQLKPEVILMDIQMPKMDGLSALTKLMVDNPIPVVVFSAFTEKESYLTIECLQQGAVDVIQKPGGTVTVDLESLGTEIAKKLSAASKARLTRKENSISPMILLKPSISGFSPSNKVIVIVAGSNGGPMSLELFCAMMPKSLHASILISQHLNSGLISSLAEKLDSTSAIVVKEAQDAEELKEGVAYVAPGDIQMTISADHRIVLSQDAKAIMSNGDVLIESAVKVFGGKVIGVELSGEGNDGKRGMALVKINGGKVICQDEQTSMVFDMPKEIISSGNADFTLPIEKIPLKVLEIL